MDKYEKVGGEEAQRRLITEIQAKTVKKRRPHSPETRRKISLALTGQKFSPERSKAMSIARKGVPRTHGMTNTPTYKSWDTMLQRCNNKHNENYKLYGAKGVGVCERWLKFENFLADMGERPKDRTLDRIDVQGNYDIDNCRWADKYTQARNQRLRSTNTSGYAGVAWLNDRRKWVVQITARSKPKTVGYYATLEEAIAARKNAELIYWGN